MAAVTGQSRSSSVATSAAPVAQSAPIRPKTSPPAVAVGEDPLRVLDPLGVAADHRGDLRLHREQAVRHRAEPQGPDAGMDEDQQPCEHRPTVVAPGTGVTLRLGEQLADRPRQVLRRGALHAVTRADPEVAIGAEPRAAAAVLSVVMVDPLKSGPLSTPGRCVPGVDCVRVPATSRAEPSPLVHVWHT